MRLLIMMLLCSLCLLSACAPPPPPANAQTSPQQTFRALIPPTSGHFHHDPYSPYFEYDPAGVKVKDVRIQALFSNPYSWRGQRFAYGFRARIASGKPWVEFFVDSDGDWVLWAGTSERTDARHSGRTSFYRGPYARNSIILKLVGNSAEVFVNDVQLKDKNNKNQMDIGTLTVAGEVLIVNGPWAGTVQAGAITHYDLFQVSEVVTTKSPKTDGESKYEEMREAHGNALQGLPSLVNSLHSYGLGSGLEQYAERRPAPVPEHTP